MIEFFSWTFFSAACLSIGACFLVPKESRYIGIAIMNLALGTLLLGTSFALLFSLSVFGFFAQKLFSTNGRRAAFHLSWTLSLLPLLLLRSTLSFDLKNLILSFSLCFFCLQQIGALVDLYRRRAEPPRDLAHWLAYALFFPSLIAGPIARWTELRPALLSPTTFTTARGIEGALLCGQGLFKKMVFAAPLIFISSRYFADPVSYGPVTTLAIAFVFRYGIWADISSHTDWARGISTLMGLDLRPNFNRPFQTTMLVEFWRRWHMSLSTWLQDYVFYPIAMGPLRRYVPGSLSLSLAVLSTFVLLAFWHEISFSLFILGLINGSGVLISGFMESRWKPKGLISEIPKKIIGSAIMLLFMWLPTLLISLPIDKAWALLQKAFDSGDSTWPNSWNRLIATTDGPLVSTLPIFSIAVALFAWEIVQYFGREKSLGPQAAPAHAEGYKLAPAQRLFFVFVVFVIWLILADFESKMGFAYVRI